MEAKNSYSANATPSVVPYKNYENDFTNPGDFIEELGDNELYLVTQIWSGIFNGKKWVKGSDAYEINIAYHNKFHICIDFNELCEISVESMAISCNLLIDAAKLYFLRNTAISGHNENNKIINAYFPELPCKTWDEVQMSMEKLKKIHTGSNYSSWTKTMTVKEAKKLFKFLKIKVNFPS